MIETFNCPKNCSGKMTEHEFVSEHGDYNENYKIRCKGCGHEHMVHRHEWFSHQIRNEIKPSRAYLTTYPRIEPHSGEIVNSPEHERETMKRMGFHAAKHGLDERHNDELADKLKSRERSRRDLKKRLAGEIRQIIRDNR